MSDFAASWNLSRSRFLEAIGSLNHEQLSWRMQPGALSLGQMAAHVAGVEVSFASQLRDLQLTEFEAKLKAAATDGVVNDLPFPFADQELTPDLVAEALTVSCKMVEPMMASPSNELRSKTIKSALGPMISGEGALARLAFHPAYHQGQAHLVINSPGFP